MAKSAAVTPRAVEEIVHSLTHRTVDGRPAVVITGQLDPKLYKKVDQVIRFAGGRWKSSAQAHLFDAGADPAALLDAALEADAHIDDNPHDFFGTPPDVADDLVDLALDEFLLFQLEEHPDLKIRVLEPSVGQASLIEALYRRVPAERVDLVCFEIDPRNQKVLRTKGIEPHAEDFLTAPIGEPVDIVLMNPPFAVPGSKDGWALHVQRAQQWLKPGGRLGAVIPQTTKSGARLTDHGAEVVAHAHAYGSIEPVRDGAFATSANKAHSTNVKTETIWFERPLANDWRLKPTNGFSNWYTYATSVIIENNDVDLLHQLTRPDRGGRCPSAGVIEERLLPQRKDWIRESAPWVSGMVNAREIATNFAVELTTDQPTDAPDNFPTSAPAHQAEIPVDNRRRRQAPPPLEQLPLFGRAAA